jgi:type IV pilus assembly protein PilX
MVLVVSLVFLLVLTLLGLAAMQNTSLEERMAGNLRAEKVAMQAAEAALRAGEFWLVRTRFDPLPAPERLTRPTAVDRKPGAYSSGADAVEIWMLDSPNKVLPTARATANPWWTAWIAEDWVANGAPYVQYDTLYDTTTTIGARPDAPRYVIEDLGVAPSTDTGELETARDSLTVGMNVGYGGTPPPHYFQVTARGVGPGGRGEVLLRSTFRAF